MPDFNHIIAKLRGSDYAEDIQNETGQMSTALESLIKNRKKCSSCNLILFKEMEQCPRCANNGDFQQESQA